MKKALLLIFVIIELLGFSQSAEENHEKYWYYRYRMRHYFTDIGPDLYQSLVGAKRNKQTGTAMIFGDQPLDMGWYMGVLATEYDLLKPRDNQTELDQTLTELYYLMKAMERLDKCEGKEPYPNQTEALDGFFLRKDYELASLPSSSQQDVINNLNYKLNENDLFGWKPPGHPTYIDNLGENDTDDHFDMSQDQLIHLLIGYSAVLRAFSESPTIINFYDNIEGCNRGYSFFFEARSSVSRMVDYASNLLLHNGFLKWNIYRPDGGKVDPGANMTLYSYGLAMAAFEMLGMDLYRDIVAWNNYPVWMALRGWNPKAFNNNMELILGTIGNSWADPYPNSPPTEDYIFAKSIIWNWDLFYIPFYRYIHRKDSDVERVPIILEELNSAPLCGPYRYATEGTVYFECCGDVPANSGDGWSSHNRYRRTKEEANGDQWEVGNYPGLDYMITFNLFRRLHGGPAFYNMLSVELDQTYPFQQNGQWYGTENNPANLRAFETFECDNEIETNSNGDGSLNLIASNSISLSPGFHVYQGARFSAKVEEYDCWAAGGNGNNKTSYFRDNGYVYNHNPDPMEVSSEGSMKDLIYANELNGQEKLIDKLIIYPNPAHQQIQIVFGDHIGSDYQLTLQDVYGNKMLIKQNYYSGDNINISTLSSGIYILQV